MLLHDQVTLGALPKMHGVCLITEGPDQANAKGLLFYWEALEHQSSKVNAVWEEIPQ